MFARATALLLAMGLVGLSGCGPAKLDVNKTISLESGDTKTIDLDSQPKPQTITVEFESTSANVNVGVFKESDAKDLNAVQFSKALKSESMKKSGTLTVDLPEKTPARVVIEATSKSEVTVHVTNR